MRWIVWVSFALVLACGGREPEPARAAPAPSSGGVVVVEVQASTNPQPAPLASHSLWNGRYECAQGITGLSLTLDLQVGGIATAVFDFGPVPENPSIPSGRYLMTGSFLEGRDGTSLMLSPDRWIAQPPGYVMVGLTASIDPSARSMTGRIANPGCTVLSLVRVQ